MAVPRGVRRFRSWRAGGGSVKSTGVALAVFAVALAAGGWLVFAGVRAIVSNERFFSTAIPAQATVVGGVKRTGADADPGTGNQRRPVARFVAANGQAMQLTPRGGGDPVDVAVGRSIGVRYDPTNPQHAKFDGWLNRWGDTLKGTFYAVFGLGWSLLVVFLVVSAHRARRSSFSFF